ncbi:hypothetical protein TNCV_3600321, partial [Trichonephila clavipes]
MAGLGHQPLPPRHLGGVDEEVVSPGSRGLSQDSEMKGIMQSIKMKHFGMRNHIDAEFNGEMNNKMDDIKQFGDNLMLN